MITQSLGELQFTAPPATARLVHVKRYLRGAVVRIVVDVSTVIDVGVKGPARYQCHPITEGVLVLQVQITAAIGSARSAIIEDRAVWCGGNALFARSKRASQRKVAERKVGENRRCGFTIRIHRYTVICLRRVKFLEVKSA